MRCTCLVMTLSEYLADAKITDEAFAARVTVGRPMVTKLRHRSVNPSSQLAARIIEATGGKISFAELMPTPAPTPEPAQ